jgi:hypothetical protein
MDNPIFRFKISLIYRLYSKIIKLKIPVRTINVRLSPPYVRLSAARSMA